MEFFLLGAVGLALVPCIVHSIHEIKQEKKEFNDGFCPKCGNAFKLLFVDSVDGKRIYGCHKCDNSVFVYHKSVDLWRKK